jgi:CheY-like chemotaxis protein/anti-sigma regulatory factor (Ser/Thr protein kinase)
VEPADLVAAVLEIVQPDADAKRLQIEVVVDPDVGAVLGDSTRLQQVLWNLVANAIKFTPTAGRIRLRVIRAGSYARFVVMDSGAGIPPEFLPSVFEPFRQADATHTRLHGGLGLGLAIVKQLVEAHSGTITVDSEGEGRGAIFTVDLPSVPLARRAPAAVKAPGHSSSLDGLSVLVVDDDEETRVVVAAHLENHQATVLTAASARDALRILQREHVDVLLADVAMPGEDGYTLLRKVRAMDRFTARTIPAAALTAFARDEDRREALAAGFQMHLAKPIDAASLVAAVAALSRVVAMGRVGSPTLAQLHR